MPHVADWSTHLRWAVDEFVEIHRLIAAGLTYGALMTTRLFLERWTINVASNHAVIAASGEAESAYITRVWSVFGASVSLRMGDEWAWLSECLHGRADYQEILCSPYFTDGADFPDANTKALVARLSQIARTVLQQVYVGIDSELNRLGVKDLYAPSRVRIAVPPDELLRKWTSSDLFHSQFAALDPLFTFSSGADRLVGIGARYRISVHSVARSSQQGQHRLLRDLLGALLERRGRSVELARKAFRHEAEIIDPKEGYPYLLARLFRYSAIAQGAILMAGLSRAPEAQALRTAAAALDSAWRLWLDDADTSLGCCRGVLEQTARARVHRVKPSRAVKLEAARNAPHRWIEAAGLNRLNELGRALGEFSHLKVTSRRQVARIRLTEVQDSATPYPENSARLHALNSSAYFLAKEVYSRLNGHYPGLGQAFLRTVTLFDASGHEAFEEETMARALAIRDSDWGKPDFEFF